MIKYKTSLILWIKYSINTSKKISNINFKKYIKNQIKIMFNNKNII